MPEAYALRFISGKYEGGEFPLTNHAELLIGRAAELDMVLVEDMVSRKHARIRVQDADILISDLGSTNGTFVNGEKIEETKLQKGDRILIGTSILRVIVTRRSISTAEAKEQLQASGTREDNPKSSMKGELEELPVPDLLQLFSTSKRTGVLFIQSSFGDGKVHFRAGDIFYACIDEDHDIGPMKSLCRIVGWQDGKFEFREADEEAEFMLELEDPTAELIADAVRELEELRKIGLHLPPPQTPLTVPRPLEPRLSELNATALDVFQLVLNHGMTQDVFDRSPWTDYKTARALLRLLEGSYIERGPIR